MTLRIDKFTQTLLQSLNVRTENHGDGLARAIDLKCVMDLPNTWLDQLDPALLDMLFKPVEQEEAQTPLEGVAPVQKPLLRSHRIKFPMALELDYSGYQLTVDRGLGGTSNLVLQEVSLNKVFINCKEGGTVELIFRLQASNVGDDVIGRLSSYLKANMFIALSPPAMKQAAIDGTAGHPGAKAATPTIGAKPNEATPAKKTAKGKATAPAATGNEAGDLLAANEAAGLNKPAAEVPAPKKKRSGKPSIKVVEHA